MQKQAALHQQKHAASRRRRVFFTILFFLMVGGFFVLIRQPFLRIQSIEISGTGLVDRQEVADFVSKKITGYRYFIIPRDSLIFIKKDVLEEKILEAFPRLSSVVVHKTRSMKITITEPVFESMYCKLDQVTADLIGCVLLHTNGKAAGVAPDYSYAPIFAFYSSNSEIVLGKTMISPDEISRIAGLQNEISSYGMPTYGFIYGAEYDEMILSTGEDFKTLPRIRLLSGAKANDIHATLGTAIEDAAVKKLLLEKLDNLEYVDLRFDGQVVYKKRD